MDPSHAAGAPAFFSPQAIAIASLELSMRAPAPHVQARAILLRCFWIHDDPAQTRVALALADAGSTRSATAAPPGILACALADRARHELLLGGALPAPCYLDDFPSAPSMANADICSVNCAARFGPRQLPCDLDAALGRALDSMFLPSMHFRRHAKASLGSGGRLERQANALVGLLRSARAFQRASP